MQYCLRALWFAIVLVISARVLSRSTLVSKTPYNFAVNVTFGTLAGSAILQASHPIWQGTVAIGTLTIFAWVANWLAAAQPRVRALLSGKPVALVRGGRTVQPGLDSLRMTTDDLHMHLRQLQVANVADVEAADMYPDGKLGLKLRAGGEADHPD